MVTVPLSGAKKGKTNSKGGNLASPDVTTTKSSRGHVEKSSPKASQLCLLEQGRNLVYQFYVSIKTAQLYERSNLTYVKQSENLFDLVKSLLEEEEKIILNSKEGYLFLNEARLKFSFEGYISSKFILEIFRKIQFESLTVSPEVTKEELDEFVFLLAHADYDCTDSFGRLEKKTADLGIRHIKPEKFAQEWDTGDEASPENRKNVAKKRFFKTISVAQEMVESVKTGRSINTVKSKRAIQFLIDQLIHDETNLMSLTAIKSFDEYTFAHSVNVCILSVALGGRLGLSKKKLSELGYAALFHDIGKVRIPLSILNKPEELGEDEWKEMRKHPVLGVKTLLSRRAFDKFSLRAMVVAFEHHLRIDLSGYPQLSFKKDLNLYTRIVSIADVYDSMTSGRVYVKIPLTPDVAVKRMIEQAGRSFDPVLLKVFINMLGIYPVGSVVLLDGGEVGVVMKSKPDELSRPEVAIIADKDGKKDKIEMVDLAGIDEKTGEYKRTILKTIDPNQYKLNIARYIY
jgi:HD-GYP domain-containing protein (c-di-GMP phosphodiesterase class II)